MTTRRRPSGSLGRCLILWSCSILAGPLTAQEQGAEGVSQVDWGQLQGLGQLPDSVSVTHDQWQLTLAVDERVVLDVMKYGSRNRSPSGLEVDTAYLTLDLDYEEGLEEGGRPQLRARLEPDLIGADSRRHLFEGWLGVAIPGGLELRAGQVKVPLGSEGAAHLADALPYEYSFPASLDTRYDLGVAVVGRPFSRLWLEAATTLGDGFDLEGERRREPQHSLRAVVRPFGEPDTVLGGLHLGAALAFQPRTDSPLHLVTPTENVVLQTGRLRGSNAVHRHLEVQWSKGPCRAGVEWAFGEIRNVRVGGTRNDFDQLTAWSAHLSVHLTGEEHTWAEGAWQPVDPRRPITEGGRGALALNARYSNADMDRALFLTGVTAYGPSTQEVRTFTASLSWHPMRRNRLELGWIRTLADDALITFGGSDRDTSWFLRFVVGF